MTNEDRFQNWWGKGGQDIATKLYSEQAENNIYVNLNERVKEYYGEGAIGDEAAENNVFWYELERLAKENKLHLKKV